MNHVHLTNISLFNTTFILPVPGYRQGQQSSSRTLCDNTARRAEKAVDLHVRHFSITSFRSNILDERSLCGEFEYVMINLIQENDNL